VRLSRLAVFMSNSCNNSLRNNDIFFMFYQNQTDQGDKKEGLKGGGIRSGEIGEGEMNRLFLFKKGAA
jgi:hypothetical protein